MKAFFDRCFLLRPQPQGEWSRGRRAAYWLWRWGLTFCAGLCMGLVLLLFAYGGYSWEVFLDYFRSPLLLTLNALPAAALALLFYAVTGRAWAGFLAGGGVALGFSLGSYFKLLFRDDPLYFADLLILREAGDMAASYRLFVDKRMAFAAVCLLLGTALLRLLCPGKRLGWKGRTGAAAAVLAGCLALWPVYGSEKLYDSVENFDHLNRWSPTQNYVSRGFFYPFLHSIGEFVETPPEGYSKREAQALLDRYQDRDIPRDKQVSVIAIMREAYVDFSQYGIDGLDVSGYDLYHGLEAESYRGDLLTNIFAGGTIDTERCFLTGNYELKNFRGSANSYLWYLRDQGYTVEGSHPYYQWFYNRQNVNSYLGFQRYRYYEDTYGALTKAYYPEDAVLYPQVLADYKASQAAGKPYFSFVLNVQSHGPYDTENYDGQTQYLTGDYSQACKNAVNNYMDAIMQGDEALMDLVDQLREDPDPVVLVLFSDHLPWMGDGNVFYDELGMDIDPGTEEGFRRHYTTRYLLWANAAAREVLDNDFTGDGPTVSPCYLMNLLFDQCGWTGPAFMQAMEDMRQVFPVVTTHGYYVVDGDFTDSIPAARRELFDQFRYLQHYWRNEFLE